VIPVSLQLDLMILIASICHKSTLDIWETRVLTLKTAHKSKQLLRSWINSDTRRVFCKDQSSRRAGVWRVAPALWRRYGSEDGNRYSKAGLEAAQVTR
jgi:hypothetical protein